ncbi:MAG: High confidence in function and specificity, partial [Pseudomonadota bacterium]
MKSYILAIDQGTTGSTALVMSADGRTLSHSNREFAQHFPEPGWVEHEPEEIWESVEQSVRDAVSAAGIDPGHIGAVGITNQRETTLLWDKASGRTLHRAIVWQDRRTAALCAELREAGHAAEVTRLTGLVLDPYFSGTKLNWLFSHYLGAKERAERGELCAGTVDSYLLWRICGGLGVLRGKGGIAAPPHRTDISNASRTLLMDLDSGEWSERMCQLLGVPRACLPEICPSAGVFGQTLDFAGLPDGIPVSGIAGDQHAALFGQGCFAEGSVKCTYGTGAFLLVNTGSRRPTSRHGLLSTVAWQVQGKTTYALEGGCFIAGAAVQWLRDGLGILSSSDEVEALAASVATSEGVTFVPALSGLGAPYWDPDARGAITGLTRGSTAAHLARATLEAIALQVDDLVRAMGRDLGKAPERMRVDGGAARNN